MKLTRTEYTVEHNLPVIYLFERDGTKRYIHKVTDFKPYFYIPVSEENQIILYPGAVKSGNPRPDIWGNMVQRVNVPLPVDVSKMRDSFTRTWEADVQYSTRYTIDEIDEIESTVPKVLFLDIECESGGTVPDPKLAEYPIYCVSLYDGLENVYYTLVWKPGLTAGFSSRIYDDCLQEFRYFDSEYAMLEALVDLIRSIEPDVITGWNVINFDLMYLFGRLRAYLINPGKMSSIGSAYQRERDVVIKGVSIIDLLDAYKHIVPNMEESYRLDFISNKLFGEGKTEVGSNVNFLWKQDLERLLEYNIRDVYLTKNIDSKMRLIEFIDEIRRLCFCQHEDTLSSSRTADSYILRMFHGQKVFPTKVHHEHKPFEGAYVGTWAKGIYSNVAVLDLKSLYPSIIVSAGLSPETLVDDSYEGDVVTIGETKFRKDIDGFLPEVINHLFKERAKYKNLMKELTVDSEQWKLYDLRQYSLKVLLNALYGQTAFAGSRLYSPKIAEAVTHMGRDIIKWSRDLIESLEYKVVLIDTDSLFLINTNQNLTVKETEGIRDMINASYSDFAKQYNIDTHIFSMEFEKLCRKAFFGEAKKRHALHITYQDGQVVDKLGITGFETRRSDSSRLTQSMMTTLFEMILRQDQTKKDVLKYLSDQLAGFKSGESDMAELGIPKGINKPMSEYKHPPANVRGAIYATDELKLQLSNKPKMVYIDKMPMGYKPTDVLCFDTWDQIPPGTQIDVYKMLEKTMRTKLDPIFDALGWKLSDLNPFWKSKRKNEGAQMRLL